MPIIKGAFASLLTDQLWTSTRIFIPKSRWQVFKMHYMPSWFTALFPIRFVEVELPSEYPPLLK